MWSNLDTWNSTITAQKHKYCTVNNWIFLGYVICQYLLMPYLTVAYVRTEYCTPFVRSSPSHRFFAFRSLFRPRWRLALHQVSNWINNIVCTVHLYCTLYCTVMCRSNSGTTTTVHSKVQYLATNTRLLTRVLCVAHILTQPQLTTKVHFKQAGFSYFNIKFLNFTSFKAYYCTSNKISAHHSLSSHTHLNSNSNSQSQSQSHSRRRHTSYHAMSYSYS